MNFFGMLSKLFDSDEYRKNPIPQNLTSEQFAAINIGAINAEQTEYICEVQDHIFDFLIAGTFWQVGGKLPLSLRF